VEWQAPESTGDEAVLDLAELARLLLPLRIIVAAQAVLLIVILAPVSIFMGAGTGLLLVFVAYYLLSVASIVTLVLRRRRLRVSVRECGLHAFEILACAPFALNIVRKLSLRRSRELPWLVISRDEFRAEDRDTLLARIAEQSELLLLDQDPGSEKERRLLQLQATLRERLNEPRRG
jgi:hypothetical protein